MSLLKDIEPIKTKDFLKERFKDYYKDAKITLPPRFTSREWGFRGTETDGRRRGSASREWGVRPKASYRADCRDETTGAVVLHLPSFQLLFFHIAATKLIICGLTYRSVENQNHPGDDRDQWENQEPTEGENDPGGGHYRADYHFAVIGHAHFVD